MKKNLILFIILLFSLWLLFSCGLFKKKTDSEMTKKTGNIAGIVFDVITMEPLVGAVVYVEGMITIGTKTDTLGRFWLSAIPVGVYKILADKIYYYRGETREVKVYNQLTSIVHHYLVYTTIPERPHWNDWDSTIIKTDSVTFFNTQYKNLLKKQ